MTQGTALEIRRGGHASLYRGKKDGVRIQGILTPQGGVAFEQARRRIAEMHQRTVNATSDADVVEFLARHWTETLLANVDPPAEW
jgi:hypothetical protein